MKKFSLFLILSFTQISFGMDPNSDLYDLSTEECQNIITHYESHVDKCLSKALFDLQKKQLNQFCKEHIFSECKPDNRNILLSYHGRDEVLVENFSTGETIKTLSHLNVSRFSYSPDGKYIFTQSKNKLVKIWDAETFKLVAIDFFNLND